MPDVRIGEMPGVTGRAVDNRRRAWCRGAKDHGFTTDTWTLNRVRRVIAETFGAAYTDLSGCGGC
jgi:hypothetical protein